MLYLRSWIPIFGDSMFGSFIKQVGLQIGLQSFQPKMQERSTSELKVGKFEEAELFASLPYAIAMYVITGARTPPPEFRCPNRAALEEACKGAKLFDRMTVPPVNYALEAQGKPLTKKAYQAIIDDIKHTNERDPNAPLDKQAEYFREQAANQRTISQAFGEAGEHEGASLHNMLSNAFDFKASLAEAAHKASLVFSPRQDH